MELILTIQELEFQTKNIKEALIVTGGPKASSQIKKNFCRIY